MPLRVNFFAKSIVLKHISSSLSSFFTIIKSLKIFSAVSILISPLAVPIYNEYSNLSADSLGDSLSAIERGLLKQEDFEKSTENEIVEKLENSTDESIQKVWQIYKSFDSVFESSKKPNNESYYVNVKVKRRYIDPLYMIDKHPKRLSTIDQKIFCEIEEEKNNNKYYSINYQLDCR